MPAESSSDDGLLRQLTCHGRTKALLFVALWAAFGIPYLLLQRYPLFTPGRFPLTTLDRAVGFHPGWIWVYQSAYLLIPIAPLLSRSKFELAVYTRGFLLMTLVGIGFFVFLPIEAPRPADVPHDGLFGFLLLYDRTINTFPSLHVALVVHSVLFGWWRGNRSMVSQAAFVIGLIWVALICYSTLATKQHYAVDIPGGVLLGWASQWWASRTVREQPMPANASLQMGTP